MEFIYESLQNKYGKTPILEKKMKETLHGIIKNSKSAKIQMFSRFLAIEDPAYSNDDLTFYYSINQIMFGVDAFVKLATLSSKD